jgi:hypothetical protein
MAILLLHTITKGNNAFQLSIQMYGAISNTPANIPPPLIPMQQQQGQNFYGSPQQQPLPNNIQQQLFQQQQHLLLPNLPSNIQYPPNTIQQQVFQWQQQQTPPFNSHGDAQQWHLFDNTQQPHILPPSVHDDVQLQQGPFNDA